MSIKLWKDNKLDQEHEIEIDEIAKRFWEWDAKEGASQIWTLERCIRVFITDKEENGGLQSVFDEDDYQDIYAAILDTWPEDRK